MSVVAPANNTYAYIESKVRKLTASSSESSLRSVSIQEYVNNFYNQNFPNSIKTDQMRDVYTFYTRPYIDKYPLDVNYIQGVRMPMYVDGINGFFFKDRGQFYNMWPRWPTQFSPFVGDGVTQQFSFLIPGPFLRNNVTLGTVDVTGVAINVGDDGNGNLQVQVPNPQVSVPSQLSSAPGMKNLNTMNPGQDVVTNVGSVDYVTGQFNIDFALSNMTPASGTVATLWVSQYQTGKPYSMLFWNNEFTIRPVPKLPHKIEIEIYLTPVQFMLTTDSPIMNQWVKYIAYGAAIDILTDRQDFDGVANLMDAFKYEEGLVLEHQGVEEIGQRNTSVFASTIPGINWNNGYFQGWY